MIKQAVGDDISQCMESDGMYAKLCEILRASADSAFPKKTLKTYLKPYWTEELSALHARAKRARAIWCREERARGNSSVVCREYKLGRLNLDENTDAPHCLTCNILTAS
ncbi:hypothetical protein DPMN_162937 [Dreissena polymorpha]|uniref:Uncharacterized protein n=1 Tax=Dreissena polymorpha TaxID=45954 RepID=A0A9D4ISC7_DREPO|nr:hypothetical protein DPMN_162937 [Dreissena polymorpha]